MSIFNLKQRHAVVISPGSIIFAIVFILGLYALYLVRSIVVLLFLAFIIMTALRPGMQFLARRFKIPKPAAIFLTYLLMLSFLTLLIGLILPPLGNQLFGLVKNIEFPYFGDEIRNLSTDLTELSTIIERIGSSFNVLITIVSNTFSGVLTFFTLVVMSVYMMVDRPRLHKKVMWFSHDKKHIDFVKHFIDDLESQLGGWVRGQSILMFIVGVTTYIGLALLGIPYALPLALLAGLLEIVPNLGPTVAAIPAIIAGYFVGGPVMAGVLALFYVILQQFENNLIVPKILQDNADVNPLISITVILIGLELGGVVGALLGVPVYIVARASYAAYRRHYNS